MINKRQLLHILSWTILFAGIAGGYLSYRYRQGVNAGNYAASLLGAGKLDEAIEYATKAIELRPDDGLGYYVRGVARFRLITEKHAKESLDDCKNDLKRALELTQNETVMKFSNQHLKIIEELQSSM